MVYARRRNAFLFVLFSLLTLGIYGAIVIEGVRKEIDEIGEKENWKPSLSSWLIYFLGFFTLGIVPLVYLGRLNRKVGILGKRYGIKKPKVTYASFELLFLLGSLILIGPFLAFGMFFSLLYKVELAYKEEKRKALEEERRRLQEEEKRIQEEKAALEAEEAFKAKVREKLLQRKKDNPSPKIDPSLPYQIHLGKSKEIIASFSSKEEAVAFARKLAKEKGSKVIGE